MHTIAPTGHILSRLELQALDSLLSAYSDESLREIRLTVQRQRGVTAISREEVEWLLRQRGQFSFAEFLEESIEKGTSFELADEPDFCQLFLGLLFDIMMRIFCRCRKFKASRSI